MPETKPGKTPFQKLWPYLAVCLLTCAVTAGLIAWSRYTPGQPIEIKVRPETRAVGMIYVGGNVTSPGYYTVRSGDTLAALLNSAGAPKTGGNITLSVGDLSNSSSEQKVDINRAPAWLLQALPGIGEARAAAIIRYRETQGLFRSTADLTRVEGISAGIYDRIKDLITVAD